ncbi:hypothetical protein ACPESR_12105 [Nocardia testacea]|uniref:hypothetical protein n=1 Tax=Nocardia testacea TaxID=248551 RepID=UPI003C2CC64D
MRASVTVEGSNGEWIVAFTHSDRTLLDAMKKAIPRGCHWDNVNKRWRVTASIRVMAGVCTQFERLEAAVTRPETLTQHRTDDRDHQTAEHWENRFRAMDDAARRLHEQIQQLIDERDDLVNQLKTATQQTATANDWAETLFDAVGPALHKTVFKTLTTCLHPDRAGAAGHTLQQQLNAAYGRARR